MLRSLRIIGIVIFALLIGSSAHTIRQMHESGSWFERYNHRRQSTLTLLTVSTLAFTTLAGFELVMACRRRERPGYGQYSQSKVSSKSNQKDATNIYSAPETIDKWEGRHSRTSRRGHRPSHHQNFEGLWLLALRGTSLIFPAAYLGLLVLLASNHPFVEELNHSSLFITLIAGLCLYSILTATAIFMGKVWGLLLGLLLALGNLLVFPAGTVAGLVFIVVMACAAPFFMRPQPKNRVAPRGVRSAAI